MINKVFNLSNNQKMRGVRVLKNIKVLTVNDGGNPRYDNNIKREENGFLIHPFSENDNGNYRFRLNVEIVNHSKETVPVLFKIEWGDTEHQESRKYILLSKDEDQWQKFDTKINDTKAQAVIDVPPGSSYLCMHPRYNHGRFIRLVESLPENRFEIKSIGKSRLNRDVYAIETGARNLRPLAVMARVHPYETIGSYFVDGMIKWLMNDDDEVKKFLTENHIIFVPMPNPDGVAEGTCELTLGGLNFSQNGAKTPEPEGTAVREYFLKMNPASLFDLHGWMYNKDNYVTNDTERGQKLYEMLTDNPLFDRGLEVQYKDYPLAGGRNNLGGYLADELGLVYYNSSWPWYGRNAENLRNMGIFILKSYASLFKQD